MGKIETTQQENVDHHEQQHPSSVPHSHTTTSSSSPEQKPPEPPAGDPHGHERTDKTPAAAPSRVRRQQPQWDDEIESIPAVAFPPHPGPPPEANNKDVSGGGGANGAMARTLKRDQKSGKTHLVIIQAEGNPWSSGLFDCCQHPLNATITTVAPCVTFGQIVEIVDNGSTSCMTAAGLYCCLFLVICHWNIGVRYRQRLRNAYQLADMPLTDRLAHTLFPLCALCQEFRELKNQGYDPYLGYKGVAAKIQEEMRQQSSINGPPTTQAMMR